MRLVFMGTPDFADASLKQLIEAGFEIAAVFTQPDKQRGRGMAFSFSPVKQTAIELGIPVFQPSSMRTEDAAAQLRELSPDLLVVVAYGQILPDEILAIPRYGAINVHGSLLPKYRGAAPIQWAVLNGDRSTGVSTMYLSHDMDAGDLIYTEETEIGETETSGEVFDRLMEMGASLLVRTIHAIEQGTAPRIPQDHALASYTKKLDKSFSPVDWNQSPRSILKWIYGLQPWPVATAEIAGTSFRLFAARYSTEKTELSPGSLVKVEQGGMLMACAGRETLWITEIQAPGKRRMSVADYLRGHPHFAHE